MTRLFLTTSAIAFGLVAQAQASEFTDRLMAQLAAEGYADFDVEAEDGETTIEATRDGLRMEFTYDTATETLLSSEEDDEDDADDEDDDAADDQDDDHDEDDDEDEDEDDTDEGEDAATDTTAN